MSKSCIFTGTPEMNRIVDEDNIKRATRREQEMKQTTTVKRKIQTQIKDSCKEKHKKVKKKTRFSISSNSDLNMKDIVTKLPPPKENKSTARKSSFLQFTF